MCYHVSVTHRQIFGALGRSVHNYQIYELNKHFFFTLYAFRIGEPNKRQVAVLFNDITERKRAEQAKTVFLSNVSHEFRTPLTLLLSPLQDTLSDHLNPLSPSQRERLKLAHRNAVRLLKLVNTLLDFSRIETGCMEAVYDRFSQASVPSRYSPGGVGIGLAIARQLLELHGGTIEAASDGVGRGATFTVKLPLI